ncbi:MAG: hypothetical protein ACXVZX_01300 [Terriglobales bacterium]
MFEQELELEKKSSWGPLLLVIALVGLIVGVIGYYVFAMKRGLPAADATSMIETQLRGKTATVHFHSGKIMGGYDEQAKDPHYKVLEKAGFLKVKSLNWNSTEVTVTDVGEQTFTGIKGYKKWKNADNSWSWDVPLAARKLEKIDSITMNNPDSARVEYEWKWVPNSIGELFDLEGGNLKGYTAWERQKLIDKYGADFYHAATKKEVLNFTKGDKGWQINTGY